MHIIKDHPNFHLSRKNYDAYLLYGSSNRNDRADIRELDSNYKPVAGTIEIKEMFVKPELRGKGKATKLVKKFLKQVKQPIILQAYPFESDVEHFNMERDKLIKFYQQFGFVHAGLGFMWLNR